MSKGSRHVLDYRTYGENKSAPPALEIADIVMHVNGGIAKYAGDSFGHLDLAILCPRCRSLAIFASPYVILHEDAALAAAADSQVSGVPLRSGFAVERFPELFPWNDPKNPNIHFDTLGEAWGIACCLNCPYRQKRQLQWPDDAFYKIELSCGLLWARNRDELLRIRESIADPRRFGWRFSNRLNKSFFLRRNRDRVLRGIGELLSKPEVASKSKTYK